MVKSKNVNDILESIYDATSQTSASDSPKSVTHENYKEDLERGSQKLVSPIETQDPNMILTLPDKFSSMVGESIDIETDNAQELIGMLGKKLGIDNYRTNLANFWLLDAIALEVLRNRQKMNTVNLGVLVSWIAGEAKLIQEKQLSREEFFREMGIIFANVCDLLGRGNPLMYWEEIIEIKSIPEKHQTFQDHEKREAASKPNSKHSIPDKFADDKNSEVANTGKHIDNTNKAFTGHSENVMTNSPLIQKSDLAIANSMNIFETIVESTYAMYGNAFHYESVHAAFIKPIKFHSYQLPYTMRFPRPVQLPVLPTLRTKAPIEGLLGKARAKTEKEKPDKIKGKEKSRSKSPVDILLPPSSLTEEETIAQKRKQIFPLMKSNEASHLLEQFAQSPSMDLIAETKWKKKGSRKLSKSDRSVTSLRTSIKR